MIKLHVHHQRRQLEGQCAKGRLRSLKITLNGQVLKDPVEIKNKLQAV